MSKLAKKLADDIFTEHYSVLFDSESDKGQECLVSILAIKSAIKSCEFALNFCGQYEIKKYKGFRNNKTQYTILKEIIIELKKM